MEFDAPRVVIFFFLLQGLSKEFYFPFSGGRLSGDQWQVCVRGRLLSSVRPCQSVSDPLCAFSLVSIFLRLSRSHSVSLCLSLSLSLSIPLCVCVSVCLLSVSCLSLVNLPVRSLCHVYTRFQVWDPGCTETEVLVLELLHAMMLCALSSPSGASSIRFCVTRPKHEMRRRPLCCAAS